MKKFIMIFGALLVVSSIILTLAGCSNSTTTTTTTTTTPTATLSVEDQNYTIQFGYYNCDHMTAGVFSATSVSKSMSPVTVKCRRQ